jgi:heme/copper-type cytochrome/quinol oxidase subunit 3
MVWFFLLSRRLCYSSLSFEHSSLRHSLQLLSSVTYDRQRESTFFDPKAIPLLNTLILLCSGATVTYSHHAITAGNKVEAVWGLVLTIILAIIFTALQAFEYISANFTITDGIYGSTFFIATGFHGAHVFIGTCFLAVCLVRLALNHFTIQHHFGFEAAAFYWHFVDVVWLFLYVAIYYWGGL